jgi:hypothetical protein
MRPSAPLRTNPGNDLVRIGDVARLAVNAVGRIELQVLAGPAGVAFHLIHGRRAEILAWIAILGCAAVVADVEIGDPQVRRLVFLVVGRRVVHVGELVESELAIGLNPQVARPVYL